MEERKHPNVEFLNTLKEIFEIQTNREFAKICGQQTSNISNYLNGNSIPQKKALRSCLTKFCESQWKIDPLMEIKKLPKNYNEIPEKSGIYIIYSSSAQVLYVGKASNFRSEIKQTLGRKIPVGFRLAKDLNQTVKPKIGDLAQRISLYEISSGHLRHNCEALLLRIFINQTHNLRVGNFK